MGQPRAMESRDFYHVLGVSKGASIEEVRKAYKKKAVQCHPDKVKEKDRTKAEEEFKVLAEAYATIVDPDRRAAYDMCQADRHFRRPSQEWTSAGRQRSNDFGNSVHHFQVDPNELYHYIFNGPFRKDSSQGFGAERRGAQTFESFNKIYSMNGGKQSLFHASRAPNHRAFHGTPDFETFGVDDLLHSIYAARSSHFAQARETKQIQYDLSVCLEELYLGSQKRVVVTQQSALGVRVEKDFQVNIQPGLRDGSVIKMTKARDEAGNGVPIDVAFIVQESPHPLFKRDGDNLMFDASISLADALTGCKLDIPYLNGNILHVDVQDVVHPTYKKLLPGFGMPTTHAKGHYGDLIISFQIVYPTTVNPKQREAIRNALQPQTTDVEPSHSDQDSGHGDHCFSFILEKLRPIHKWARKWRFDDSI